MNKKIDIRETTAQLWQNLWFSDISRDFLIIFTILINVILFYYIVGYCKLSCNTVFKPT